MRKLLHRGLILFIIVASFSVSCKKDEDDAADCTKLANNVSTAATNYMTDPSDANCKAYATALKEFIDDCGGVSAGSYQTLIDGLPCK